MSINYSDAMEINMISVMYNNSDVKDKLTFDRFREEKPAKQNSLISDAQT